MEGAALPKVCSWLQRDGVMPRWWRRCLLRSGLVPRGLCGLDLADHQGGARLCGPQLRQALEGTDGQWGQASVRVRHLASSKLVSPSRG